MSDQLSDRQRRFVMNLMRGMTQTRAYKEAGYNPRNDATAAANASALIRNPKVSAFWQEQQEELLKLARSRLITLAVLDAIPVLQQELRKGETSRDRIAAAKDLADRAGLKPTDKHEYSGGGIRFVIDYGDSNGNDTDH